MPSRDAEQELAELAPGTERFFTRSTALWSRTVGRLAGVRLSASSVSGAKEFERGRILTWQLGTKKKLLLFPFTKSALVHYRISHLGTLFVVY